MPIEPFPGAKQNLYGQREEILSENNEKANLWIKKQADNSPDITTWMLIAGSIVVLAGGLFVAFQKKY